MKINKYMKYFLSVLLFSVILFLTFHTIFIHNDISDIVKNKSCIEIKYVLVCLSLIIVYFLLQGIYMKRNLNLLKKKISVFKGIFYSIVEFFFSGITPSSTGGQPVQLYYMNKDKIQKKKALITLLINTIYFKLIIVILGILILIFKHELILSMRPLFIFFYFLGIIVDLFIVIGGYLLLYKQIILKKILQIVENIIKVFFKNYEMKIDDNIEKYSNEVNELGKHKLELFFEFLITFLQRVCLFSISYVVYKAFGLSEYNFFEIIIIQISVQVAIEFIPLPGGTGVSEYLFNIFFITAFGSSLSSTAMLVTRTFSFYIPLILSGVILLFNYLKNKF
ncbi:MAG: YbhN family protein [Bacilli bacterium]